MYVVQADLADERDEGVAPTDVLKALPVVPQAEVTELFHVATEIDAKHSSKVRNHLLYERLGYRQPPLYMLRSEQVLLDLAKGTLSGALRQDLERLTARPLVIRTSSSEAGVSLLPRSDLLQSGEAAEKWLLGPFREEIERRGAHFGAVSLIAHHFIPALASAFSSGGPLLREVYVESLWGIPEGLYYFPCDAYLVDTQVLRAEDLRPEDKPRFVAHHLRRFKGQFVAPDASGRFVVHSTERPWDWKLTIGDGSVLGEIAMFTRQLAREEGQSVKVMWFLDCPSWTNLSPNLPWYHDNEVIRWNEPGNDYARNSRDEVLKLRTLDDLVRLESEVPQRRAIERRGHLVIHVDPTEDRLIRNECFAERVGRVAKELQAFVELGGGRLSHVYYTLQRAGASVVVRHRSRFPSRAASLNKLVRDRIPEVVARGGELAKVSRLPVEELRSALRVKLVEEAFEVRDASEEELAAELADVLEVVAALIDAAGLTTAEVELVRRKKQLQRGGFEAGIVLHETAPIDEPAEVSLFSEGGQVEEGGIVPVSHVPPLEDARAGAFDVRRGEDFVEFIQSALVGVTYPTWSVSSPRRVRIDSRAGSDLIEWVVEGHRIKGGRLQLKLRVRLGSSQLTLPLGED